MVRFKNRYVVAVVTSSRKLPIVQTRDLYALLLGAIASNFGDVGAGLMQQSTQVVYYNATTRVVVVRCGREFATCIQACLTFITEFHHQDIKFETLRVCGSNRTCKDALLAISLARIDKDNAILRDTLKLEIEGLEQ
ncbi:hypothetical protein, variant [Aphanomyces invadans]|uniref:Ribonuclease P/MRP protein subunit POP5 n=1 Tax=Aphanomyces invadans TaxID=157072 RepID=A0A024TXR1_9STRA|nr:hypothetical protein, variant [Aphanomyces invadans]XP_008872354.1 hypothetical protein H310_08414 [Aphanomyces invadans]ETV98925.1 hypothetical protein H310_08414 [Aphanomyces invadans]ETV98926.1 hypothetical protein, variant [Aphanomyces invadans]|eukprot:XP_008872353.1 hypothetical protein, variant [Aphanomyces invadans]